MKDERELWIQWFMKDRNVTREYAAEYLKSPTTLPSTGTLSPLHEARMKLWIGDLTPRREPLGKPVEEVFTDLVLYPLWVMGHYLAASV